MYNLRYIDADALVGIIKKSLERTDAIAVTGIKALRLAIQKAS